MLVTATEPREYSYQNNSDGERQILYNIIYLKSKKIQMNIYENRNRLTDTESKLWLQMG